MIVCVCCNVNEREIREAGEKSLNIRDILENTCAGCYCEKCIPYIEEIIEDIKNGKEHNK